MKIICEHCGTNIDLDKDILIPGNKIMLICIDKFGNEVKINNVSK